MRASWSPEDTEAALRGHVPASADAARVREALTALRARSSRALDPSDVATMAATLASAARTAPPATPRNRARTAPASAWRRRAALAGIAAFLASAGVAGTAAAADGAAPGDALYGIDRALEAVGIGNGGSHERIDEATQLAGKGDVDGALQLAAEALDEDGDATSAEALLAAAHTVAANGSESSAEVHSRVSEMLRWMSETDARGSEFGRAVSDYARGIGEGAAGSTPDAVGGSDDPGTDGEPGNSGSPGRPDSPGKSDSAKNDQTPSGASEDNPGRGNDG